jgi:hypothetical protein
LVFCAPGLLHKIYESSCRVQSRFESFWETKPYYVIRLKEHNTCTCKYLYINYNLILFSIIHLVWKVNALIVAQKSSWPTLLKTTSILFFIYNGSVINLLFMVKLGSKKTTKYCGYNTRKPQQRCSLINYAQSWKGLCYTIIFPNSKNSNIILV